MGILLDPAVADAGAGRRCSLEMSRRIGNSWISGGGATFTGDLGTFLVLQESSAPRCPHLYPGDAPAPPHTTLVSCLKARSSKIQEIIHIISLSLSSSKLSAYVVDTAEERAS